MSNFNNFMSCWFVSISFICFFSFDVWWTKKVQNCQYLFLMHFENIQVIKSHANMQSRIIKSLWYHAPLWVNLEFIFHFLCQSFDKDLCSIFNQGLVYNLELNENHQQFFSVRLPILQKKSCSSVQLKVCELKTKFMIWGWPRFCDNWHFQSCKKLILSQKTIIPFSSS